MIRGFIKRIKIGIYMFVLSSDKYCVDTHIHLHSNTVAYSLFSLILILKYNAWFMRQLSHILGPLLYTQSHSLTLDSNWDRTPLDCRKKLQTAEPQKLHCWPTTRRTRRWWLYSFHIFHLTSVNFQLPSFKPL
jgi:hypothetical protein